MKIGIITYHRSHNYGAYMQAYALSNYLREHLKLDVEIIDYNTKSARKMYIKNILSKRVREIIFNYRRYRMFNKAVAHLPLSKETFVSDDIGDFFNFVKDKYDVIITGSDEVWRFGKRGFPNPYWLPGELNCKKIAYGVSSRTDFSKLDKETLSKISKLVSDFEYVGVRDNVTYENVKNYLSDTSKLYKNCDPVFLYDFKQSVQNGKDILKERFLVDISKPTVALMMQNKELSENIVDYLKKTYGDKYNYIALYANRAKIAFCPNLTPFEWSDVIAASDFLITTFFHGMCFAIKSDTPFVTIECRRGEETFGKNYDMLSEVGMLDRLSYKTDPQLYHKLRSRLDADIDKKVSFKEICKNQKRKSLTFISAITQILQGENYEKK